MTTYADSLGFAPNHRNYQVQLGDMQSSDVEVQGVEAIQDQFPNFGVVSGSGLVGYFSLNNPGRLVIWTTRVPPLGDLFILRSVMDGFAAPPSGRIATPFTFPPAPPEGGTGPGDGNNTNGGNNGGNNGGGGGGGTNNGGGDGGSNGGGGGGGSNGGDGGSNGGGTNNGGGGGTNGGGGGSNGGGGGGTNGGTSGTGGEEPLPKVPEPGSIAMLGIAAGAFASAYLLRKVRQYRGLNRSDES